MWIAALAVLTAGACDKNQRASDPSERIECPNGPPRVPLDCSSEVAYQGKKVEGGVALMDIFQLSANASDQAMQTASESVQRYVSAHRRLCDQYNACMVDPDAYLVESRHLTRDLLATVDPTGAQKQQLATVYPQLVGEPLSQAPIELSFRMNAQIGGSEFVVRPNMPVPSQAKINFAVSASSSVYLYMFQKTQANGVTPLFPLPNLGLNNPLSPGQQYEIPPKNYGWYQVDDQDIGTENVYLVASPTELGDLQAAVAQMSEGSKLADSAALAPLARMDPGRQSENCRTRALVLTEDSGCSRTRGLVLVGGADNLAPRVAPALSLKVQSDPGDPMIVKVFPWRHVTEADYGQELRQYEAPDTDGEQRRGILME